MFTYELEICGWLLLAQVKLIALEVNRSGLVIEFHSFSSKFVFGLFISSLSNRKVEMRVNGGKCRDHFSLLLVELKNLAGFIG